MKFTPGTNFSSRPAEYFRNPRKVVSMTEDGKCSQCGGCCSNILPLTIEEVGVIEKYIEEHNIKPHVINMPTVTPTLDLTCPFLNLDKTEERCNIYPVRPYICQVFQCNNVHLTEYLNDKKLMKESRHNVDMRQTFFPTDLEK